MCRACNETSKTVIEWCLSDTQSYKSVCGNDTSTFHKRSSGYSDVYITSDGNIMLRTVRSVYGNVQFGCTKMCSDGSMGVHNITLSVEGNCVCMCVFWLL